MAASKQTRLQLSRLGVCNVVSVFALLGVRAPLTTLPLRAQRERARPPSGGSPTPPPPIARPSQSQAQAHAAQEQTPSQTSSSKSQSASVCSAHTTSSTTTCTTSQTQSSHSGASGSGLLSDRDSASAIARKSNGERSPGRDLDVSANEGSASLGSQLQRGQQPVHLITSSSLTSAAVDPSSASRSSSATSALYQLPGSSGVGIAGTHPTILGGSDPPVRRPATLVTQALIHSAPRSASSPTPTASPSRTPVAEDASSANAGTEAIADAAAVNTRVGAAAAAEGAEGGGGCGAIDGNGNGDGDEWSLSVALPGAQTALVHVADWVTVRKLSVRLCAEARLDAQQHYLRVHLGAHGIDYIPDANERVAALVASAGSNGGRFELAAKSVFRCTLLPHPETDIGSTGSSAAGDLCDTNRFGLHLKARLVEPTYAHSRAGALAGEDCTGDFSGLSGHKSRGHLGPCDLSASVWDGGRLAVHVKRVAQDGPAECAGLLVDDEVLAINEQLTADLDMMYVEQLLSDSERLVLVVRSCRDRPPATSQPIDPSELFLLQSRAPSVPPADCPEANCPEPSPTPIHCAGHPLVCPSAASEAPVSADPSAAHSGFNVQQAFASSLAQAADQSLSSNPLLCEHLGLSNAHTIDSESATDSSGRPLLDRSITPTRHSTIDRNAVARDKSSRNTGGSLTNTSITAITTTTSITSISLDRATSSEAAVHEAPIAAVESSTSAQSQQEDALTTSTESGAQLFPRAPRAQQSGLMPAILAAGGAKGKGGGRRSDASVSSASGSGSSASGGGRLSPIEKLERAAHELLSTERRYVSDLELLHTRYLLPLRTHLQHQNATHQPLHPPDHKENGGGAGGVHCTSVRVEVEQLADTVADLHQMHAALLDELERSAPKSWQQRATSKSPPPLNTTLTQTFEVLPLSLSLLSFISQIFLTPNLVRYFSQTSFLLIYIL